MTSAPTTPAARLTGRSLVSSETFDRLTHRVATRDGLSPDLAARAVDQMLVFLPTLERHPLLRPSTMVDLAWHAFLLDTPAYAEFCDQVVGRFVHHVPDDDFQPDPDGDGLNVVLRAIEDAGYTVDPEMWQYPARCGEVGCGAGRPPQPPTQAAR